MVKQSFSSQKIYINGKEISSFDDLPPDVKERLDKDGNGQMDFVEKNPELQKMMSSGEAISGLDALKVVFPFLKDVLSTNTTVTKSIQTNIFSEPQTSHQDQAGAAESFTQTDTTGPNSSPIIIEPPKTDWIMKWLWKIGIVVVLIQLVAPETWGYLWQILREIEWF